MSTHLLTGMIFLPFLGAVLQAAVSAGLASRWLALGASAMSSLLGAFALGQVRPGDAGPQLVDRLPWIGSYAIHYELAVDGTSVLLLLLISAVFPVLMASEWERKPGARGLYALLLILQGSLIGAACAQDLFLLFFFWSLSSLPVFFLVGVWGGERKELAAFRTLVTSTLGNTLLFAAFVLIYYSREPHTFLIRDIVAAGGMPESTVSVAGLEVSTPALAFFLVCAGLALRAPVWPVHGWFSRLADEAPASVFVAVAAATVPVAVMTFCRISNVLFPSVMDAGSGWILGAGMLNLFVGSVSIIAQRRLAGMVAYLCVVQLGLCLVGLGSQDASAMAGVIFHQLGAGLALAAIGLLIGGLATRAGVLELSPSSGGLARTAPAAAAVMGLAIGAFVGVPGMSGFVGQSLIAMGGYSRNAVVLLAVGASSLLVAYSLFGAFRRLFLGEPEAAQAKDAGELTNSERIFLIPLVGLIVLLGFFPKPFLDWVRPTAAALVARTAEPVAPAAEGVPVEAQPTPAAPSEQGP